MKLIFIAFVLLIAAPAFAADENCITPQEGALVTKGLDALVRSQGLSTESEASLTLAHKVIGIVQRCQTEEAKEHDAEVLKKAEKPPAKQ